MQAMLAQFLTALLQSLVQWGFGSLKEQGGIADELQAKTLQSQLASEKAARAVEAANAKAAAAARAPLTPAQWNAGSRPLLVLLALLCCGSGGCALFTRYVYVNPAIPLIQAPERPALPADPPEFTERERALVGYATRLEAAIGDYNDHARAENARNGY